MRKALATVLLLSLVGCKGPGKGEAPVEYQWSKGQEWYLATAYRVANVRTEESPVGLDGAVRDFGEHWTDDVVWTYQVVESDLVPSQGDELYRFAKKTNGDLAPLTVIKASVNPAYNDDPAMLEADPVIYLVFRAKRNRLAGMVSFRNVDGERVQQAWSARKLGRSWSALSQSMLTAAPTYLPPHGVTHADRDVLLENGSTMSTVNVDSTTVDVVYDDEIGGDVVASRLVEGQPWPTWTVSDNVDSRMLSRAQVDAMRTGSGGSGAGSEDFDYRAALASSIDIEDAISLDEATMAGGWDAEAPEGFQPWNGSWWRQSEAALVFGYKPGAYGSERRPTYSQRLRSTVEPIKTDMDKLSKELRDMDDGEAKDAKREEYSKLQRSFVDELVTFYDGIRDDLDGGQLTVANGKLTHDDGWSYDLDELSPMDKFALQLYFDPNDRSNNPFYLPAWELLNHYSPEGGSWWGHCNGWSGAAILLHEPTTSVDVSLDGQNVEYTTGDLKGLMSESYYSTYSRFYGKRYYKDGDDITDLHPQAFHKIITHYIRDQQVPLVFDTTAGDQVWNFPAYGVQLMVEETTEGSSDKININTASAEQLDTLPGIGSAYASRIIEYRETFGAYQQPSDIQNVRGIGSGTFKKLSDRITVHPIERSFEVVAEVSFASDGVDEDYVDNGSPAAAGFTEVYGYTLVTDQQGLVISGTWDDPEEHPDFAWIPYSNPTAAESGGSENPYLSFGALLDVLGDDLLRK